jgi:hypothetical protein
MPTPLPVPPRNPGQIYGETQLHENVNTATGTPIYWEGGSQPPIPYEQPKQVSLLSLV